MAGDDRQTSAVARMVQRQRLEKHLVQVRRPALAAGLFDDGANEHVAGIVVVPVAARCKRRRFVLEHRDQRVGIDVATDVLVHVTGNAGVALDAGGVVEQLRHRDGIAVRIVGQEPAERIVQRDLALVDQLQQAGGGELLGHRTDAEDVVGRQRHAQFDARLAARAAIQDLVAPRHEDRHAGAIGRDMLLEQACGFGRHRSWGWRRICGNGRGQQQGRKGGQEMEGSTHHRFPR
nr:hypothetical protein [Pseudofulvimonas gallinarii]